MSMAAAFAAIARGFGAALGGCEGEGEGPFVTAQIVLPGTPVTDSGGSITAPGAPDVRDCLVQIDSCTEAMRAQAGYADKDVRLLVLGATLEGAITTSHRVIVFNGPNAGLWLVQSASQDPAGIGWELRGRRG